MNNTNNLTNAILRLLNLSGWKAWRNNTVGIWDANKGIYRRNKNTLKGVSDIIGFNRKTGQFIGIEIKTGKDSISPEQILFLKEVNESGGIGMIARTFDQFYKDFQKVIA